MKYLALLTVLALAGCGLAEQIERPSTDDTEAAPDGALPPPETARTIEDFDTTTPESRAAAADAAGGRLLGQDVASLGDPSVPGFWVETPLVSEATPGRAQLSGTGNSVEVELRPSTGGSARISLAALRVLGAPLTDLATIDVFAR